MKTFDFSEEVRKETAHKGTGSYPVQFHDETGNQYNFESVHTDFENGVTVIQLREA